MIIDVWKKCKGIKHITKISTSAWRIIEYQEETSTRKLVDSFEEQDVLDNLIEKSKPLIPLEYLNYNSLLYTPFRYPPLKNGSRFGKKTERSIWYGSLAIETAMAEKAYQQLLFINGSSANFGVILPIFTVFSVKINTTNGVELNTHPFLKYKNLISSPVDYQVSQILGEKMREEKIEAFSFNSARDKNEGINIGLFSIGAFDGKNPHHLQTWQCILTKSLVKFTNNNPIKQLSFIFSIDNFLINGLLPSPAL